MSHFHPNMDLCKKLPCCLLFAVQAQRLNDPIISVWIPLHLWTFHTPQATKMTSWAPRQMNVFFLRLFYLVQCSCVPIWYYIQTLMLYFITRKLNSKMSLCTLNPNLLMDISCTSWGLEHCAYDIQWWGGHLKSVINYSYTILIQK